ncbi:hypothetical protein [Pseudorhodoferax sp. Leaf274]|uniref:hypothetical protein n=1 Tax=Pseudorhodoferax sp. Leaf274 TaxID=1736318 RepID=UPI000703231E|nr:hypothetical protein [Pseudorhodoferax sp. Leaf274]KQP36102.1 hypothetical protein ASF44_16160 [Pseudorhodoferax sp. Leaf274]
MKTKTDYTALDVAIIAAICVAGHREFQDISRYARRHAEAIEAAENRGKPPIRHVEAWRIVDRRLQHLRKAGRISYTRQSKANPNGGWVLTPEAA